MQRVGTLGSPKRVKSRGHVSRFSLDTAYSDGSGGVSSTVYERVEQVVMTGSRLLKLHNTGLVVHSHELEILQEAAKSLLDALAKAQKKSLKRDAQDNKVPSIKEEISRLSNNLNSPIPGQVQQSDDIAASGRATPSAVSMAVKSDM